MVAVFREVKRVLRDNGTLWLNIGDSYWGGKGENGSSKARRTAEERGYTQSGGTVQMSKRPQDARHNTIKPKDLIGIPWMLAFALRADGWYLRSDIIWSKPNPMPESVTDRPTKAHEYVFLLAKSDRYFYDADAIAEPLEAPAHAPGNRKVDASRNDADLMGKVWGASGTRNKRTVWTITPATFREAHFATMPPELAETCIKAGSAKGDMVLDPFGGAGTTGLVADRLGRHATLIELNPKYAVLAEQRIKNDNPLFAEVGDR
jgi:DNA modification methylase